MQIKESTKKGKKVEEIKRKHESDNNLINWK